MQPQKKASNGLEKVNRKVLQWKAECESDPQYGESRVGFQLKFQLWNFFKCLSGDSGGILIEMQTVLPPRPYRTGWKLT